jgi:hypothetical protein
VDVQSESEIRRLAYAKWQAAGSPILDSHEERSIFWHEAEKEIREQGALVHESGNVAEPVKAPTRSP